MLAFDKNKTIAWNPQAFLAQNTAAPFAQLRGMCECGGTCEECQSNGLGFYQNKQLGGLGFTLPWEGTDISTSSTEAASSGGILNAVSMGASFVPGIGTLAGSTISIFSNAIKSFETWLGIGKGRAEADIIVPVQNELMNRLNQVTNAILLGKSPSMVELQGYYLEVWQLGLGFMEFVINPQFTDRRASGQALNGIMPYIDGSCGYAVPLGTTAYAGSHNCLSWGSGTLGGNGTDGMLGAIGRAIRNMGGTLPRLQEITAAASAQVKPQAVTLTTAGVSPIGETARQYGPYILLGLAVMFLTRAGKQGG